MMSLAPFFLRPREGCPPHWSPGRRLGLQDYFAPAGRIRSSRETRGGYDRRVVPRPEPPMQRDCTRCRRPFALADLSREDTQNLEVERKAQGLEGVKFVYFRCP